MEGVLRNPMLNILLADDDEDERFLFRNAIRELPVKRYLKTVSDGVELSEYLIQNSNNLPDVLFLDIMMPRKNGIECLKEIMSDKVLKRIPVVMYSNSVGDGFISTCYECGASYFLQKGIYAELPESIDAILGLLGTSHTCVPRDKFQISVRELH